VPLVLLLVGVTLLITAFKGTTGTLGSMVKNDITGTGPSDPGFAKWLLAFAVIGGFSYIPGFRPVANAFLALVIIALILAHGGFFAKLSDALNDVGSGGLNTGSVVIKPAT
jgi:hypothetical protein